MSSLRELVILALILLLPALASAQAVWRTAGSVVASSVNIIQANHVGASQDNRLATIGAWLHIDAGEAITSVSYGGAAGTIVTSVDHGTTARAAMYRVIAPATGDQVIEINFNQFIGRGVFGVKTFSNVHQTTPLGTANTAQAATGGTATVTITSVAGDLVNDVVGWCNAGTITPGADQTSRWNNQLTTGGGDELYAAGSTEGAVGTSTVMSWTNSVTNNCWAVVGVPIKAAAVSPSGRGWSVVQ